MLGASVVGLAVVGGGLVPEEIEAFGITVTAAQEKSLLYLLIGVLTYFVIGFIVYAWADLKRRSTIQAQARARLQPTLDGATRDYKAAESKWKNPGADGLTQMLADDKFKRVAALSEQAKFAKKVARVGTLRILFDVALPVAVGLFSIGLVLRKTKGFPGWRWVAGFGALSIIIGLMGLAWKGRQGIFKWFRRLIKARRDRKLKKLTARIKNMAEDDPRKRSLQEKAKEMIELTLKDMTDGMI